MPYIWVGIFRRALQRAILIYPVTNLPIRREDFFLQIALSCGSIFMDSRESNL